MDIYLAYYPQTFLLVFFRLAALVTGTTIFGQNLFPRQIRIFLALTLALILTPTVPVAWAEAARELKTLPWLLVGIGAEVLLGITIALLCEIFVGVISVAGYIAGWSSSLMMSQTVDPTSGVSNNIMGIILQVTFMMLMFCLGVHLVLLQLLHRSFSTIPPAVFWLSDDALIHIVSLGQLMFEWGMIITAPLFAGSMIMNTCMGLLAKVAPDFNILFLSLPIRLGMGMLLMACVLRYGGDRLYQVIKALLDHCEWIFQGAL